MYYLCYFPCPLYFFQLRLLFLFFGRDRTESPIDVLFFTASRRVVGNPFAFFMSSDNSFSSFLFSWSLFSYYYCDDDGDDVLVTSVYWP